MSGQVLDYETKRILNERIDKGRKEGIIDTLITLVQKGQLSLNEAAQAGISETAFQEKRTNHE